MEDTNTNVLIRNVAADIIATTAIWGIINQSYNCYAIANNNNNNNKQSEVNSNLFYYCSLFSGVGISLYFITKYK